MHAEAECGTQGIIVYLLPGLTAAQRSAALRRLRQEGSRGCGPRLPSGQLAAALAADRLRVSAGNTGAAVRLHPVGTLLPALLAAVLLAAFVLASVSDPADPGVPALGPGTSGVAHWSSPRGPLGRDDGRTLPPPGAGKTLPRPTMILPEGR